MWRLVTCVSALLVCMQAESVAEDCSILGEDGATYRIKVLASGLNDPSKLVVDWKTNTLYFNHYLKYDERVSAKLKLGNKNLEHLHNISMWCSHTIDQDRGQLYLGCVNHADRGGLYRFDSNRGEFVLIGAEKENIQVVHYSGGELFYSATPMWWVQTWSHGQTRAVPQLEGVSVEDFVVDGAGEWVYGNSTAMCRLNPKTEQVKCKERTTGWLTTGPSGAVYSCSSRPGGIYIVDEDVTQRKVVDAPDCDGLAIDRNGNFIYANEDKIFQLIKC